MLANPAGAGADVGGPNSACRSVAMISSRKLRFSSWSWLRFSVALSSFVRSPDRFRRLPSASSNPSGKVSPLHLLKRLTSPDDLLRVLRSASSVSFI